MLDFIEAVISQFQTLPLWSIILFSFVSACIQQFFPPYPSEVLLLLLGGIAIIDLRALPATIVPYVIGTVFSSLLLFYISRRLGKPILRNKYIRKVFPRRNQCKARLYMKKFGTPSLAICKFLPGVNTVCIIIAGVMGLRGIAPVLTIAIAGIVENVVYFAAGMVIGENLPALLNFSSKFSFIICAVIVTGIVAYIIFKIVGKTARKTSGVR
jgi:membrane protein DedA with SNARE-associated domain